MAGRPKGIKKTGGRKKGTPNKLTSSAKEAFQRAFDDLGGACGLAAWAKENPTEFYKLFARLIPLEVSGSEDNPLKIEIVRYSADENTHS